MQPARVFLSNNFAIRNENGCSYLCWIGNNNERSLPLPYTPIPPTIGWVLATIGENTLSESLSKISREICVNIEALSFFIDQLTNNESELFWKFDSCTEIVFPKHLLTDKKNDASSSSYTTEDFNVRTPFKIRRPSFPLNANVMVTCKCTTNCIYCYADRSLGDMPFDTIKNLLHQLKNGGCMNIGLSGGDIFARKDWKELIKLTMSLGFPPFISTKTPLKREDLRFLKDIGLSSIQFSLDSTDNHIWEKLLAPPPNIFSA